MKTTKKLLSALLLFLLIISIPLTVFAEVPLDTELTYMDVVTPNIVGTSVETINYSIAPANYYPFVYTGTDPFVWLEVDTSSCTIGKLYLYNKTTDAVTSIGNDDVTLHVETKDHIFYVTKDSRVVQSDFLGNNAITLYNAGNSEISYIGVFGTKLYFIENGNQLKVVDVPSGVVSTALVQEGLHKANMFAEDQLILRTTTNDFTYYNMATKQTISLENEYQVNCVMQPYVTSATLSGGNVELYAVPDSVGNVDNNIGFPLSNYPATLGTGFTYPTATSRFTSSYAGSNECDGFAKYAHDAFLHITDWSRSKPSWITSSNTYTADYSGVVIDWSSVTQVREFFEGLTEGAFVRYGKDDDDYPQMPGVHSIAFSRINHSNNGIYAYECNQDSNLGVFYQNYTYAAIYGNYDYIDHYVNHTFTEDESLYSVAYHKVGCTNCDGYLLSAHTEPVRVTYYSQSTHKVYAACCDGPVYLAHTHEAQKTLNSLTAHTVTFACCGSSSLAHTGTKRHFSYNDTQHKITFTCCSGYILENHVYEGNYPECLKCGYSPELGYSLRDEASE